MILKNEKIKAKVSIMLRDVSKPKKEQGTGKLVAGSESKNESIRFNCFPVHGWIYPLYLQK